MDFLVALHRVCDLFGCNDTHVARDGENPGRRRKQSPPSIFQATIPTIDAPKKRRTEVDASEQNIKWHVPNPMKSLIILISTRHAVSCTFRWDPLHVVLLFAHLALFSLHQTVRP